MTDTARGDERDVPRLRGAQRDIRDAFLAHDSGLFVLDCNPGAGKSTVAERLAADTLARAHDRGERAPERGLCVTSFARDDAAAIRPGIEDALRALTDDTDRDADADHATAFGDDDARTLARRVRASDTIGTIDGVLRTVFADVATDVGFDATPDVGNEARLAALREDCLAALRDDAEHEGAIRRLDAAYPGGEHTAGLDKLLVDAHRAARERRLTVDAFEDRLRDAVGSAYPEGPPDDFAAVARDIAAFVDPETAERTAADFDAADREAFRETDRATHDAWRAAVADFCALLRAFGERYDARTRERGVASHLDVSHWVAAYFGDDAHASDYRAARRAHYAARLDTLIVDEAQDVSAVQHDALAPFVDADTRVLLVGDVKQCIYAWRNAHPDLFERARDDGVYFGVDWETHVVERAQRTYRARPDVAAAIDAVFADVLTDSERGNAGALTLDYPPLVADRPPLDATSVHVAAHGTDGRPGTRDWAEREAAHLATYLAGALTDGTLDTPDTDDGDYPGITVLFPRRTHMDAFADALAARGISVADASQHLFAHPSVRLAVAVVRWLVAPFDAERTAALRDADAVPDALVEALDARELDIRDAADTDDGDGLGVVLDGLRSLAERRARHASDSGARVLEDVVERLHLSSDPLGVNSGSADRRVAALDALLEHVADWTGDDRPALADLAALLERYAESPRDGPSVPVPDADGHDVVFRTINQMKGDEDDVVVLADLSAHLGYHGPHRDVLLAHGDHLALAPPADCGDAPAIDGYDFGVYANPERAPDDGRERRDAGLRWASERWVDGRLAGPPALAAAAGDHRAERWRLLYVAATRARDHLVLSLPRDRHPDSRRPRDHWMDALHRGLGLAALERGTRTVDTPAGPVAVDVNDVPLVDRVESPATPPTPHAATGRETPTTGWTPRYVNASTLHPLVTDPDTHLLDHLQGNALHTARDAPADSLALSFDGYGPDAVGTVAHAVLATAVAAGVDTETLRACRGPLAARLDAALHDVPPGARAELRAFVADTVCPQFADTDTWARLRESDDVHVEDPLDAVVRVDGLAVETQNVADVVSRRDGRWYVDDLKVALAPSDPATRARYDLQTATYAWVLERQHDASATPVVTRLGVDPAVRRVTAPVAPVEEWFAALGDLR